MKTERPIAADDDHRVIQFRPRSALQGSQLHGSQLHGSQLQASQLQVSQLQAPLSPQPRSSERLSQNRLQPTAVEPLDLSRYEKVRPAPDDFRQRMLANIAAFAFTVALTAIGIWLAMSIADLRKTQDCVLMGRRDCVRIPIQHY